MMQNFKNLFRPRYFFAPSVFIVMYLWTTYTHFFDITNNQSGQYLIRFAIITIVFLISIIFLFFGVILISTVKEKYQPFLLLIYVIVTAALRGYVFDVLLTEFVLNFESRPAFRVSSSILNFTISAVLATIANGKVRENTFSVYKLVREQKRLSFVEKVTKENLQEFDLIQIQPIKNQLLASIKTLRSQSVEQALFTIRKTIDDIVQPLSRSLDELISKWSPPEISESEAKINWKKAASQAAVVTEVDPKITPVILTLIGMSTIIPNYGQITGGIIIVQSFLTGFVIYSFVKKIITKISKGALGFLFTLAIAGFLQGLISLIWSYRIDASLGILVLTPTAAIVVGFLIAIVNTASRQLNEVRLSISQTTSELSWAVSRIRNEQHQRSRNLGRKLHGEIQARFSSAFLMLQNNQNEPVKANLLILEIADNLEKDVMKLQESKNETQDLNSVLDNVKQTWQGLATIKFVADENLKQAIQNDNLCQTALIDIIPELCFNSIKHGKADELLVLIEQNSPKTILLKVQDNGRKFEGKSTIGLGTKLLEECAISWKREKAKDLVITSAEFAFSS
jgi:signal transduction histidine kinase